MTADAADRRAAELVRVVEAGPVTFRLHVGDESVRDLVGRSYAEAYAARLRSQIAAELRAAEARGRAAERERCAGVAEAGNGVAGGRDWLTARRLIAARIRGGE
jgi:ADP-ribose pyrophosphatase YjhB (NUDIX family)